MNKTSRSKNSISGLAALLVFGIFAVCVLLVLLQGANTYQKIHSRGQASFAERTSMQFLAAKVRQADGPVILTSFGDDEALLFDEEFDGENYTTWIYCYDGWLREYFGPEGEEPMPELGEPVLEAGSLSMALEDNLLWILLEDEWGEDHELQLYLRSGGEELYEE